MWSSLLSKSLDHLLLSLLLIESSENSHKTNPCNNTYKLLVTKYKWISNSTQNRPFQIWVVLSRTYIMQLVHKYWATLRKIWSDTTSLHYLQSTLKVFKYFSGFSFVEVKIHFLTVACIIAINTVVCDRDSGHSEICGLKRLIIPSLSSEHLSKCCITPLMYLKYLPHLPQQNCLKSECTVWWVAGPSLEAHTFTPSCRSTCLLR